MGVCFCMYMCLYTVCMLVFVVILKFNTLDVVQHTVLHQSAITSNIVHGVHKISEDVLWYLHQGVSSRPFRSCKLGSLWIGLVCPLKSHRCSVELKRLEAPSSISPWSSSDDHLPIVHIVCIKQYDIIVSAWALWLVCGYILFWHLSVQAKPVWTFSTCFNLPWDQFHVYPIVLLRAILVGTKNCIYQQDLPFWRSSGTVVLPSSHQFEEPTVHLLCNMFHCLMGATVAR